MVDGRAIYDDGVLRITRTGSPPGLAIIGEADESTYLGLVGALGQNARGHDEVHLYLADLRYCDLAGLRALVRLTETVGGPDGGGTRVVLHETPPQLKAVLRIVGWDSTPGLAVSDSCHG